MCTASEQFELKNSELVEISKKLPETSASLSNFFSLLKLILLHFDLSLTLHIETCEKNLSICSNFLKTFSSKIKKCKNISSLLTCEVSWLEKTHEFDFSFSKRGPKRKSFSDLSRSGKYQRLHEMSLQNSPDSNLNFSFSTVKKLPSETICSSFNFNSFVFSHFECWAIISSLNISINKYKWLFTFFKNKTDILRSYDSLLPFRKNNIDVPLDITENSVKCKIFDVLEKTIPHLFDFTEVSNESPLEILIKVGGDGMTDGSDYKICSTDSDTCDNTTFSIFLSILAVSQNNIFLYSNPSPNSPFFCRPIEFHFRKESLDFIKSVFTPIFDQINSLKTFSLKINDIEYSFVSNFYPSMVDGKCINALENITWTKRCYLCEKGCPELNKISPSQASVKSPHVFKYGCQPLHIVIRATEWVLKIAYYKSTSHLSKVEREKVASSRKQTIFEKIKNDLGFRIDMPSIRNGRTTDGNMARILFSKTDYFSSVLDLDSTFIKKLSILLACVSSSRRIMPDKYKSLASEVFDFYSQNYITAQNISPTIHRLLVHGAQYFENLPLPTGVLSEQSVELGHKFTKKFKKLAYMASRQMVLRDVYNRFNVLSHPKIARIMTETKNAKPLELMVDHSTMNEFYDDDD